MYLTRITPNAKYINVIVYHIEVLKKHFKRNPDIWFGAVPKQT